MISQPGVKQAAIIAGVAITYFISARLGLSLATMPEQVTAIWPPAGVGVAALILFGIRAWPGVFLGAFFANAFTNEPLGTALLIGAGNTLECVFAKWTVQRFSQFQPRLNRLADVVLLLGPAALMGGAIGASIGVFSLWMGGLVASPQLGAAWHLWWLGDATGIAIFAPVILTWSQRPAVSASKPGGIEAVLFLSALAAASALIFLSPFEQIRKFNFLLFPFVVWSAYRLGQQWTAAAVVLTSVIAVAGELHQTGASHANLNDRLLLIQVFVGMLALTGFSLGAVVAERRRLQSALEASQQQLEQRVSEKTAELAASRKTLQDFIDNMHTFTAKLDTSGNFLLVGRAAQLASALPQHELMKVNFLEGAWWSFDPEVQHRVKAAFAQTLQGKPVRYEERIWIVSQKCELTINLSLIPVLKADGTVDYVLAEGSDITAQKHAEEQLRQAEQALKASHGELEKRVEERTRDLTAATESLRRSEQWLQAIIDNSNAVVYVKDLEGRYLLVNREWERVNGVPREKAIGRTMFEVYPKDVAEALSKNDRQVAGSEQPFQFEEHVVHPGGTRTYISNKFALRDPGGVPYAICGIATDITLRKESEQREKQAKEMAEAANRSKDEFLAVLSHELRTPLTPILGWTRMLSTGALNGIDTAKGLQAIERNVKAQGQLIEDLLDISRIITGKLKISPRPMRLGEALHSAAETVRAVAEARQVTLRINADSHAGEMSGDPERLRQVAWNLLSNAIKFSSKGGEVNVSLVETADTLTLVVQDQGEGIAPEFLPNMFSRFSQADSSTTRQHGGLGLGLAIVKNIVEYHGGSISAFSAGKGKGATFTVHLPRVHPATQHEDSAPQYGSRHKDDAALSQLLRGLKVLAVDDEPDAREFVAVALKQWDAEVRTAESVSAALDAIQQARPHLVVCDIGMPGQDGFEFARRLRERGNADLPVIALTAYARADDKAKILSAGFETHIPKPVDPYELASTVAAVAAKYVRNA